MILYNITVSIDYNVHQEWLIWMKEVHIPDVMSTGLFLKSKIAKIHASLLFGMNFCNLTFYK